MRNVYRTAVVLAAIVAFVVLSVVPGRAQTSNGTIAGTVVDKSGAGVPDARIEVTSMDRGGTPRVLQTDSAGTYRVESLPPGTYSLVVKKGGFADIKVSGIDVKASLTTTVNGTMEIAAQAATVEVVAAAGQELQTQSGDMSANITEKEIQSLPIFGLNPISLVLTQAGVAQPSSREDFTNGVGFSVNGTRPRANNFLIDGQDNNDNAINGQAFQAVNLEAIGEVTVLTNSYSAQYGRGGGSVTNVLSKGGTNTWHGSAFDIHRNSALGAIPAELKLNCVFPVTPADPCKNPVDIENTYGFSIGGPIIKNKLFVFGSPQWDHDRSTANGTTLQLPTANGVATLQAVQPTLTAAGQANVQFLLDSLGGMVGLLPGCTLAGSPVFCTKALGNDAAGNPRPDVEFGLVSRSGVAEKGNDRQVYIRTDWNAGDKDTISARYIRDDSSLVPDFFNFANALPPYDSQQGGPADTFGGSWVHTISPKIVNELRASYTSIDFTFGPTPATAANPLSLHPSVTLAAMPSGFPTLGFNGALPQGRAHKTYQYQEQLSYSFKTHTFHGGVDVSHLNVVDSIPFNSRGSFSYNTSAARPLLTPPAPAYTSLGNYVDDFMGTSGSVAKVFGSPVLKPFVTSYAPFVEDSWRMRSNFTVTLGFRYEYFGNPENILQFPAVSSSFGLPGATFPGSFAKPQKSDRNNFAPRIGLAYTPQFGGWLLGHGKTVFRAGYGIFYDVLYTNILDNTGAAQPNAVGGTITSLTNNSQPRGTPNATSVFATVTPKLNALNGGTTVDANLISPLTHQWNFDIQREIGGWVVTGAYVGTRGEHLFVNREYNPRVDFGARMNPAFGPFTVRTNAGDSIYHAAQLTVEHRFARGFLARGAYTFSKFIDDGSEIFVTSGLSSFAQDPTNQRGDRGLSAFDRRNRLALTYIWDLPYIHRHDGAFFVLSAVTRDWQTSGTIYFQSGAPETVTVGFDILGDGRGTNDRPNLGNKTAPINSIAIDGAQEGAPALPGVFYELNNGNDCTSGQIGAPPCVPVDPSNFHWLIQAAGLGNVGRNTFITPGRQDWNMSIQRAFKFTERHALMFRGEFYNAFNHPNLGINSVGNTPDLTLLSNTFDNIAATRFGGRQIKIMVRYSF